jgi:hypothetical protein
VKDLYRQGALAARIERFSASEILRYAEFGSAQDDNWREVVLFVHYILWEREGIRPSMEITASERSLDTRPFGPPLKGIATRHGAAALH